MTIEWIHPDELRNHPTNLAIYGDVPDQELVDSVRKYGVFPDHPIGYVMEGEFRVIVSGHRRRQAAKMAKRDMVPIVRLTALEGDPLAIEERIILSNKQRIKTNEQLAREAAKLSEILKAKAPVPIGTESIKDQVAKELGTSGRTAQRLINTGKELNRAERRGDTKKADRIKSGLEKSVSAGEKAAKPPKNGSPVPERYDEKLIDKPLGVIRRELDNRLSKFPGTEKLFRAAKYALSQFADAMTAWRSGK